MGEERRRLWLKVGVGKMVWNAALRRGLLCVLALWLGFTSPPCKARIYTNHWAVRIAGGPETADQIADKYGYRNMGQVGDLVRLKVVFLGCLYRSVYLYRPRTTNSL